MIGRRLCALGCSIACVAGWFSRSAPAQVPPSWLNHVQLHVSAALLDDLVRQPVGESLLVRDTILGVPLEGHARVTATTHLRLVPHAERAVFEMVLQGTARSATTGQSPPVIVHSEAITTFTLTKRFFLDDAGLASQPATCRAETHSVITAVDTEWPGVRGWLARRLGWRRVQASHDAADAIAARHAERDLSRSFDQRCAGPIEQANVLLASRWLRGDALASRRLSFYTTHQRFYARVMPARAAERDQPVALDDGDAAVLAVPAHAIGVSQWLQLWGAWLRDGVGGVARQLTGEPLSAAVVDWLAQPSTSGPRLSPIPSLADGWFRLTLRAEVPAQQALSVARRAP